MLMSKGLLPRGRGSYLLLVLFSMLLLAASAFAAPAFNDSRAITSGPYVPSPRRQASDLVVPAVSFFVPGFGQWYEDQHSYGLLYTGTAVTGTLYSGYYYQRLKKRKDRGEISFDERSRASLSEKDGDLRNYRLGATLYSTAGALSAFHSFRTAVAKSAGTQYSFLPEEVESPSQLALAPFRFTFLRRPTTFVPLTLGAALMVAALNTKHEILIDQNRRHTPFTGEDALFTGAYSYGASLGEEAMVRGWVLPLLQEKTGSPLAADLLSSLVFALAHFDSGVNRTPVFEFAAGYYFAYLTRRNNWQLSENVFVHAWWDVFAFAASYAFSPLDKEKASPIIWFPPVRISF